jgi:hypothetical protein
MFNTHLRHGSGSVRDLFTLLDRALWNLLFLDVEASVPLPRRDRTLYSNCGFEVDVSAGLSDSDFPSSPSEMAGKTETPANAELSGSRNPR